MPFIKPRKANEAGQEVGPALVNTDQILVISAGPNATELQMADGKTKWAKETPDEITALMKASA
jgi:hypothetical protein